MKSLICVALLVALASAGYAPNAYYPQHVPVIGPNGVPIDTPEVQQARAEHLAAHGHGYHGPIYHGASFGVVHAPVYAHGYISSSHYEIPQISPQGVPLDTAEVSAAKAHHFAAYAEAAGRNGILVGPIDTPEVQLAKSAHFSAHAQAAARAHGIYHYRKRRSPAYGPYAYAPQHVPVIGPNGVPLDTPEVQHERAAHFALFNKAAAEAAAKPDYGQYSGAYAHGPVAYAGAAHPGTAHPRPAHPGPAHPGPAQVGYAPAPYHGPIHIPVLNHLGVPVDTPEVQHARASHFEEFGKAAAQAAAHPDYSGHAYAGQHY